MFILGLLSSLVIASMQVPSWLMQKPSTELARLHEVLAYHNSTISSCKLLSISQPADAHSTVQALKMHGQALKPPCQSDPFFLWLKSLELLLP